MVMSEDACAADASVPVTAVGVVTAAIDQPLSFPHGTSEVVLAIEAGRPR
jgi:hypothetical protein